VYRSVVKTERFDTDRKEDLESFDKIMNNPLCVVLSERDEKITDREMGSEGNIVSIHDRIVKVITYKEKSIL
jgi:hypothetical protein